MSSSKMKNSEDGYYVFAPIPKSRYAEVLEEMTAIFFRDEPLGRQLPPSAVDGYRAFAEPMLRSGLSALALGPKPGAPPPARPEDLLEGGVFVGACLSQCLPRSKVIGVDAHSAGKNAGNDFWIYEQLITLVHQRLNLFDAFGVDKIFELGLLGVHPDHRRKALGRRLLAASLELAAEKGFAAVKVDCTWMASAKAAARLGLTLVYELPYAEYAPAGRAVFAQKSDPGARLRVLAARLQPREPFVLPTGFLVDSTAVAGPYH